MTIIYADHLFEKHLTGYHPECPERTQASLRFLESLPWFTQLPRGKLCRAAEEIIIRTHSAEVLEQAKRKSLEGGGALDADTYVSSESFEVALHAVGSALAAVDDVLRGKAQNAFCLLRPPGHHATPKQSMGFCLFNTIAIAAHYARDVFNHDRILIVDYDVHHGNGTQDIFYADSRVHFMSIHRHPFYPGTGTALETGTGDGLGATLNIPMAFGCTRAQFLDRFRKGLDIMVERCKPELILISSGFDAHKDDPVGSLGLEREDYISLTNWIMEAAKAHAKARIVSVLEGGYNLQTLPTLIAEHCQTLSRGS